MEAPKGATIIGNEHTGSPNRVSLGLAIGGFLVNFVAYYPGFLSPDSLDQYGQSITQHFNDWHPPVMSWVWSLMNHLYNGPAVMLAFQLLLLWASFYLLAISWLSSGRGRLWFFIVILLAPFIQNFAGYIIKDAQMALTWLCSFCLVVRAEYHRRPMNKLEAILSLLLLLYGTMTRINALPGAVPLFYLWAGNLFRWKKASYAFSGALVTLLLVLGASSLLTFYLKPEKKYPEYKLYLHDLAGIYTKSSKNYYPAFIRQHPGFDTVYLKANYTPATFDHLWWNEEHRISFPPVNDSNILVVRNAWRKSVLDNPGTYLAARMDGFLYYLHIKKRSWFVTLHAEISPNSYGFTFKRNPVSQIFLKWIKFHSKLPWMRPWFWLALNLGLLAVLRFVYNKTVKRAITVLLLSSLFYLLPQFFIFQVDTDFRYFYWNCLALTLAVCFLVRYNIFSEKKRSSEVT